VKDFIIPWKKQVALISLSVGLCALFLWLAGAQ
jgi:hypothetical protein